MSLFSVTVRLSPYSSERKWNLGFGLLFSDTRRRTFICSNHLHYSCSVTHLKTDNITVWYHLKLLSTISNFWDTRDKTQLLLIGSVHENIIMGLRYHRLPLVQVRHCESTPHSQEITFLRPSKYLLSNVMHMYVFLESSQFANRLFIIWSYFTDHIITEQYVFVPETTKKNHWSKPSELWITLRNGRTRQPVY